MTILHGIPVTLISRRQVGVDPFNAPVYEETEAIVDNVLVGRPTGDDEVNALSLYGAHIRYTLGIPRTDTHKWENTEVRFFNQRFRTVGPEKRGIDDMIPLDWNRNIDVEAWNDERSEEG